MMIGDQQAAGAAAIKINVFLTFSLCALWEGVMIAIAWQFEIKPGREDQFEELYGVDGEWTAVNRHSRSYLGTSFLRDQNRPSRYLVLEYWSEMVVYEQHKAYRSEDRQALDARRSELIVSVEPLGVFTALDVPDRAGPAWSWRGEK
jgi:quinol monooxygenase YgiN